jgi:hypothetical protein
MQLTVILFNGRSILTAQISRSFAVKLIEVNNIELFVLRNVNIYTALLMGLSAKISSQGILTKVYHA